MSNLNLLPQPSTFPAGVTDPEGKAAYVLRYGTANRDAAPAGSITHPTNNDLTTFPNGLGSYSKGLKQTSPGVVDANVFDQFLKACALKPGGPVANFEDAKIIPGGMMKLNGPRGAFAGQLVGKASQAFGAPEVPAPPSLASVDYAIELVELYWASLLRDVPFAEYPTNATAQAAANELDALAKANPGKYAGPLVGGHVTPHVLFRGAFQGETKGPYLSQFCVTPAYLGRVPLDQRIKTLAPDLDFMTDWTEWQNIQKGVNPTASEVFDSQHRYMRSGRDTASYTEADELYQAYLIAYLVCETLKIPANPKSPYAHWKNEKPFGTFGGPDIAATLGAVARAAINAVWWQKWSVHLRHRPEAGGGIVKLLADGTLNAADTAKLGNFAIVLDSAALNLSQVRNGGALLSQAFPGGSPTHPAYPTGHGTVAGACITVLKFFMDGDATIDFPVQPSSDGMLLDAYAGPDTLTVNGELNKLAHNISFGHGIHAGIHWRSDTNSSIKLGEAVAIAYLKDQMWTYEENFDIPITKVDGTKHKFKNH